MNSFVKGIVAAAFAVLAVIAVAPIVGAKVPESIWGLAIGTIASLVGTLIPAGKEKFQVEIPANYKARMTIEIREEGAG